MLIVKASANFNVYAVQGMVKKINVKSLAHAAGYVRKAAQRSIRRRQKPSAAGTPPHTRKGKIRRAIYYAVDNDLEQAVIGTSASVFGQIGALHEHGGQQARKIKQWATEKNKNRRRYKKTVGTRHANYPARPFMAPALENTKQSLADFWRA